MIERGRESSQGELIESTLGPTSSRGAVSTSTLRHPHPLDRVNMDVSTLPTSPQNGQISGTATPQVGGLPQHSAAWHAGSDAENQPLLVHSSSQHGAGHGGPGLDGTDSEDDFKVDSAKMYSKINWAILPLFFTIVISSYVDRTNLAFAALTLNRDLNFPPEVFGMGSGLFFVGYALCQVPSNLILRKVGGPTWLTIIVASWGLCATLFAWIRTASQFYALRLLLGVTEAGAIPGMWYQLSRFYPQDKLTLPFAVVESAIAISHTIAAPLAAACLSLDGYLGLWGWQWLFILEGIPSVLLAFFIRSRLPEGPETADFLTSSEKAYLAAKLHAGTVAAGHSGGQGTKSGAVTNAPSSSWDVFMGAVCNWNVWYMGAVKFLKDVATFGIIFWTPTIIAALLDGSVVSLAQLPATAASASASHGPSPAAASAGRGLLAGAGRSLLSGGTPQDVSKLGLQAVLLTSLPFSLAAGASLALAHHSERAHERILHLALPFMATGIAFAAFPLVAAARPILAFTALTFGIVGVYAGSGIALSLLSELAAGPSLVVALPMYNSLGNIGGFVGPYMVGVLVSRLHSFELPTILMGLSLFLAGSMVLAMKLWLGPRVGRL